MGALLSFLGIAKPKTPLYNFDNNCGAEEEGTIMEDELKNIITELLEAVTDADLLDLIYKILVTSAESSPGWFL